MPSNAFPLLPKELVDAIEHQQHIILPSGIISGQPEITAGTLRIIRSAQTGAVVMQCMTGTALQIDRAISAATSQIPFWLSLGSAGRAKYLQSISQAVTTNAASLTKLVHYTSGKVTSEAAAEVERIAEVFRFYAEDSCRSSDTSNTFPTLYDPQNTLHRSRGCGVVALLTSWHSPLLNFARRLAVALSSGCTVVAMTGHTNPAAEMALIALIHEIGLPRDIVSIIFGDDRLPLLLRAHPAVALVSLGEASTSWTESQSGSQDKAEATVFDRPAEASMIICDDANLVTAAQLAAQGAFQNRGRSRGATSRITVQKSIYKPFITELCKQIPRYMSAEGTAPIYFPDEATMHWEQLARHIDTRKDLGTSVDTTNPAYTLACSLGMQPTVVEGISISDPLWKDVLFAPIACVNSFATYEEAVEMCQINRVQLVATVVTNSITTVQQVAELCQPASLWVNKLPNSHYLGIEKQFSSNWNVTALAPQLYQRRVIVHLDHPSWST